jgi:hypothetical protein
MSNDLANLDTLRCSPIIMFLRFLWSPVRLPLTIRAERRPRSEERCDFHDGCSVAGAELRRVLVG